MPRAAETSVQHLKLTVAGFAAALLLTACATPKPQVASLPPPAAAPPALSSTGEPYSVDYSANIQCVPYARLRSGIGIFGDAHTWWDTAAGRYARGNMPMPGSVLVLRKTNRLYYGHVAVVTLQVNPREIRIDHANWERGTIITSMPVMDVSPNNDWTQLRFWNQQASTWGSIYPAEGFIYNMPAGAQTAPNDLGTTIISSQGPRYWASQQPLP